MMQQVKSEALNEEKGGGGGGGGGGRYLLRVRPNLTGYSIWVNPPHTPPPHWKTKFQDRGLSPGLYNSQGYLHR